MAKEEKRKLDKYDKILILLGFIVLTLVTTFFWFVGSAVLDDINDDRTFEEVYEAEITFFESEFGEGTDIYPRTVDRKYMVFVVTTDDNIRAAEIWTVNRGTDNEHFNYQSELLEEPFMTERQEFLYQEFILARKWRDQRYGTIND